jgi:hypothetical protein
MTDWSVIVNIETSGTAPSSRIRVVGFLGVRATLARRLAFAGLPTMALSHETSARP